MTKMKYWYFAVIALIFRGLDVLIVCFVGSINWSVLTVKDWIIIANLLVVDIYLLFKAEKWMESRKK